MRDAGCHVEVFRRIEAQGIFSPRQPDRLRGEPRLLRRSARGRRRNLRISDRAPARQNHGDRRRVRSLFERLFDLFAFPVKAQL